MDTTTDIALPPGVAPLKGEGSLRLLIHRGTPGGPGTIGTDDPSRWRHLLWIHGDVWAAELLDDITQHNPTHEEIRGHFDRYHDHERTPWRRVIFTAAPQLAH